MKELDLHKFIESKRLLISASVGLLTPQQLLFTDEISQVLVYESSDSEKITSSDDGQGQVLDRAKEKALKKMI